MNWEDYFFIALSGFIALVVVFLLVMFGVYVPIGASTSQHCLKAGFPQHQVTWNLDRYCIKRVDQTDVVVPFEKRWQQRP